MSNYQESKCSCFWDYLTPFTRFWGIVTSIVLCGVGIDFTFHHYLTGYYVLATALLVFLLEITWMVTLFLNVCIRSEYSDAFRCWRVVLWLDDWKKTVLYTALSVALFVWPHRLWLCTAAGVMMLMLAYLYVLSTCMKWRTPTKDTLLRYREDATPEAYTDRYDEIPELLDDTMPEPVRVDISDNLLDQEEILEM